MPTILRAAALLVAAPAVVLGSIWIIEPPAFPGWPDLPSIPVNRVTPGYVPPLPPIDPNAPEPTIESLLRPARNSRGEAIGASLAPVIVPPVVATPRDAEASGGLPVARGEPPGTTARVGPAVPIPRGRP